MDNQQRNLEKRSVQRSSRKGVLNDNIVWETPCPRTIYYLYYLNNNVDKYIGVTQYPNRRFRDHIKNSTIQRPFTMTILKSSTNIEEIGQWEIDMINNTDCININTGGYSKTFILYDVFSKETYSFNTKEEFCSFCDLSSSGKYNNLIKSRYVRLYYNESPEEGVKRISKFKARELSNPNNVIYGVSQKHLAFLIGVSRSSINSLLGRGRMRQTRKWSISRINEDFENIDYNYLPKGKKIKCLNNEIIYNSAKTAAQALNLQESSVARVGRGERPHTKGFRFEYLEKI